jgi:aromatic ring-opening dioxygenase catalytic subunit (LigB family)
MAEIVYGFGSSHGPLLSLAPEKWDLRAQADKARTDHAFKDGTYTYDQLLELRRSNYLADQNRLEVRKENYQRCQDALDKLGEKLRQVKPDVVVLVGDDQHEWFHNEVQPSFAVFHGKEVLNKKFDPEHYAKAPPGIAEAATGHLPPEDQMYPVDSSLAEHLIHTMIDDEFDVTACEKIPENAKGPIGITHSVGFIARRIMNDDPIPMVPVLINTFWPPNQIKPGRCYDMGKSIAKAIRSWNGANKNKRVAVIASGGLTHYVVDEEWDQRMLKAFQEKDVKAIRDEPNIMFRAGTSETKNWITALGALEDTGFEMTLLDYVPCYRSEAGTGNAMAFATWE